MMFVASSFAHFESTPLGVEMLAFSMKLSVAGGVV